MTDQLYHLLDRAAVDGDSIRLSVDDMIRSGRRWRRGQLALRGLAGLGTLGIIAAAALLLPGASHSASQVGGPATGRGADISYDASGALVAVFHDPYASAATLRAVFKQRGLAIRVDLEPASPSLVGKPTVSGRGPGVGAGELRRFGTEGDCATAPRCPVGITVSANWTGQGSVTIGAPTARGHRYNAANDSTAYGEQLYCSNILGMTVAQAQVTLSQRHLVVDEWRGIGNVTIDPETSPDLVVDNAVPIALGHVFLEAEPRAEFDKYPAKNRACYPTDVARAGSR